MSARGRIAERLVLLLVATLACRRVDEDPVVLSLGDEAVHRSDFERHVKAVEARGGAVGAGVREAMFEPFLEERVLVLEARARGILRPGATAEDEQRAVQQLLGAEVFSRVQVSDDEIRAHFDAHRDEIKVPETTTLRQILVPTESEARDVLRRVLREPKSFDLLARSRSHSPEASAGGLMGTFRRGQLPPDLEAPAFALAPGGTSDVIKTPLGYHVLKVEARNPARERTFDECRGDIRALLTRQRSDDGVRRFVQGLMARAKVNHEGARALPHDS